MRASILTATAISALLRIILITQAGGPTLLSYEHLTYAQHIAETGLPLFEDNLTWNAATYDYAPLYHYLVAFVAIFTNIPLAAILVSNVAALFIPYLIYKLTEHISTHQHAPTIAALASSAVPLLYAHTTIDTTPFTLAVPLLLLVLHLFISTLKNPQRQTELIIATIALALTTPLALIVAFGVLLGLIIQKAQKKRIPKRLTEATLLITFVSIWAAIITYNNTIQAHAITTFWLDYQPLPTLVELVAGIGILTVLAGSFGAFKYLSAQRNSNAYTLIGVCIVIAVCLLAGILPAHKAAILLGLLMLPICSYVINLYTQSKHKARLPSMYTLATVLVAAIFITTHLIPAAISAAEQVPRAITPQQLELARQLPESTDTYLWTQETGFLLHYYGHKTIITNNEGASEQSQEILESIEELNEANRIRYIEILASNSIERIITQPRAQDPCYERILTTQAYEVNKRTCVVRSRTA